MHPANKLPNLRRSVIRARPILFSGPMVRALLAGRKTQTRRVVKPRWGLGPIQNLRDTDPHLFSGKHNDPESWGWPYADDGAPMPLAIWKDVLCPYGEAGDLLWVRETWCRAVDGPGYLYAATETDHVILDDGDGFAATDSKGRERSPWRPSIHMPRAASRLTLRITDVRVQRVQDISREDEIAEGVADGQFFDSLWSSIHGDASWDANPWVWALTFETLRENVDRVVAKSTAP